MFQFGDVRDKAINCTQPCDETLDMWVKRKTDVLACSKSITVEYNCQLRPCHSALKSTLSGW